MEALKTTFYWKPSDCQACPKTTNDPLFTANIYAMVVSVPIRQTEIFTCEIYNKHFWNYNINLI